MKIGFIAQEILLRISMDSDEPGFPDRVKFTQPIHFRLMIDAIGPEIGHNRSQSIVCPQFQLDQQLNQR
jgi:hypothetical protein